MKAVARGRLLALALLLSVGVARAFVAPPSSTRPRRENGLTLSEAAAAAAAAPAAPAVKQEVLDFAIVGGGPAGLAAAVGLKDKGLNVKVFEGELCGQRPMRKFALRYSSNPRRLLFRSRTCCLLVSLSHRVGALSLHFLVSLLHM